MHIWLFSVLGLLSGSRGVSLQSRNSSTASNQQNIDLLADLLDPEDIVMLPVEMMPDEPASPSSTPTEEARRAPADHAVSFVHVGKTGGSTVQQWMKKNNVTFLPIHSHTVAESSPCSPDKPQNWLVTTRDPVSRAVSAFNWNHPTGGGSYGRYFEKHTPQPRIDEMYKCFDTANDFAEGLGHNTTCGGVARAYLEDAIGHMGKGVAYYLRGSLDCVLLQNVFLIRVESLLKDMVSATSWMNLTHPTMELKAHYKNEEYPMKNSTFLSDEGLAHLKEAVSEEYRVIRELEKVTNRLMSM